MAMRAEAEHVPAVRRNGQKPSCEPCRKSKYRCDHGKPICGRCQSRGISQRCTYHPAPMRGLTVPKNKKHLPQPLPTPPSVSPDSENLPSEICREVSNIADQDVGYLGSTAFNAVFTDTEEQIHIPRANEVEPVSVGDRLHEQITASHKVIRRIGNKDALYVLELLRDFPHLEKIANRWTRFNRTCSFSGSWLEDCQKSIRKDLYEKYDLDCDRSLLVASSMLNENTERVFTLPKDVKWRDFTAYYTGSRLRWEAIGVFLVACGLCLFDLHSDENELEFVERSDSNIQQLSFHLLEAATACVSFCEDAGHGTDLGFWLMLDNCIYASQVLGDAHYVVWRMLGDLSTGIFARGLHAIQESSDVPFWLRELRRRGLGGAYATDKMLSTFVGRPPRISKRYCDIKIPIDLEVHELALDGDELEKILSEVDENGWKKHTNSMKLRSTSVFVRPFVLEALIREEVLELCLGPPQENLREKAEDVIRRCQELYHSLPLSLHHTPETWMAKEAELSFPAVRQYLDHTYDEFMLRRLLVRRLRDDPTELLLLADRILSAVLEARNIRRSLASSTACISWIIVLNGLPAAGVLALELLRVTTRVISRSKIIQDLSVFISYLKWVHVPGDGNYQLVDSARRTLQHILDRALGAEKLVLEQQQHRVEVVPVLQNGDIAEIADNLGVYDFSWLDAGHYDQDFWENLNSIELPTTV